MVEKLKGVILATLDPVEVGQVFEKTPPHITIAPPFLLEEDLWPDLRDTLAEIAAENLRLTFSPISGIEYFGPDEDIAVRRLNGDAFSVHAGAVVCLRSLGAGFDPIYTGYDWAPHVTDHVEVPDGTFRTGFSLFRYEDAGKLVVATYCQDAYGMEDA